MKKDVEILTFDTDSATQLSLIRNLGEEKIRITLATDKNNGLNRLSKYVKSTIKISSWQKHREAFINDLIELGKKNNHKYMIIATCDSINLALAKNYDILSQYYYLPFSNGNIIEMLINKGTFYKEMQNLNINIPKTYIINSKSDLREILTKDKLPLIVKPKYMFDGEFHKNFNSKILKLVNENDLKKVEDKIESMFDKIIIQSLIKGDKNLAVYGYFKEKIFYSYCVIDKDLMSSWGTTIVGHTVENIELTKYAEDILRKLNYEGFAELEFIYDSEDNEFKLLEINCRPVQWCRVCSKVTNPIEAVPIKILNGNYYNNIIKITLIKEKYIFYELGLIELLKVDKINLKYIYKCIRDSQYISMYWDWKDLIPSIRYNFSFLKSLFKAVVIRMLVRNKGGVE
jgi:predicted ATP-grasp superfamily ATP-dependent carboligase